MTDKIGVIGAGVIGSAIIGSLVKGGYQGKIAAADPLSERLREQEKLGVAVSNDNRKVAGDADVVFVAVKPDEIEKVLKQVRQEVNNKLVISTAAAVPLKFLKKGAPEARLVRIMPNIAAIVQAAYTAYCCETNVTSEDKTKLKNLLNMMGICQEVEEKYMDAITALTGSGPGYVSVIIEGLMYAGLKVGLPKNVALYGAAQTFVGTGKLVLDLHENPSKVEEMVTTPGGTTIEAIYEIEGSDVRQALMRAVEKATNKSKLIREKLGFGE